MKQQITAESFRNDFLTREADLRSVITKNYQAFFDVAKYVSESGAKAIRIETPYGDFTLIPQIL